MVILMNRWRKKGVESGKIYDGSVDILSKVSYAEMKPGDSDAAWFCGAGKRKNCRDRYFSNDTIRPPKREALAACYDFNGVFQNTGSDFMLSQKRKNTLCYKKISDYAGRYLL